MFDFKKLIAKYLRELANKLDSDSSEISEKEAVEVLSLIAHYPMSKAQAHQYLNMSRSNFDLLVENGKMPKGRKRVGFREKVWYKDELEIAIKKLSKKK